MQRTHIVHEAGLPLAGSCNGAAFTETGDQPRDVLPALKALRLIDKVGANALLWCGSALPQPNLCRGWRHTLEVLATRPPTQAHPDGKDYVLYLRNESNVLIRVRLHGPSLRTVEVIEEVPPPF